MKPVVLNIYKHSSIYISKEYVSMKKKQSFDFFNTRNMGCAANDSLK